MGIRSIITVLISLLCAPIAAQTLNLYTFHAPPYQIESTTGVSGSTVSGSTVSGTTVDTVRCASSQMGWDVSIRTVPQNRALHSLRTRLIDGYFAVDETLALSNIAVASAPIALEKWYFFFLDPIADFKAAHIGTIAGSNEALWLAKRGYNNLLPVSSIPQLIELLHKGRVDAIVLDQQVLDASPRSSNARLRLQGDALSKEFIRFAPLRLYLTNHFTSINPDFLPTFDHLLGGCVTVGFRLSEYEERLARELATDLLSDLKTQVDLKTNIANRREFIALSDILNLDSKWQTLAPGQPSELATTLLRLPASKALAAWQDSIKGLVTETFVMDEMGAVTALSQLTSDFWQGDEELFSATVGRKPEEIVLSPLRYDPSARRFQLTASTPLYDTSTGQYIGAVAIGLDIGLVLKASNGASLRFQPE